MLRSALQKDHIKWKAFGRAYQAEYKAKCGAECKVERKVERQHSVKHGVKESPNEGKSHKYECYRVQASSFDSGENFFGLFLTIREVPMHYDVI